MPAVTKSALVGTSRLLTALHALDSQSLAGDRSVREVIEGAAGGSRHLRPVDGEYGWIIGNGRMSAEPVASLASPAASRRAASGSLLHGVCHSCVEVLLAEPRTTVSEAPAGGFHPAGDRCRQARTGRREHGRATPRRAGPAPSGGTSFPPPPASSAAPSQPQISVATSRSDAGPTKRVLPGQPSADGYWLRGNTSVARSAGRCVSMTATT